MIWVVEVHADEFVDLAGIYHAAVRVVNAYPPDPLAFTALRDVVRGYEIRVISRRQKGDAP